MKRYIRVKIAEGGRIVIPGEYRKALGLKAGDNMILELAENELRIFSPYEAIRRAQEILRPYTEGRDLVAELIAERRAEAERE